MAMASAADCTDEALIADEYDVAVDVMQAIGVFNGSKGYLNPKNTLTRAEAAKVITYLAITKTNADRLTTAEAPFADVEADNWAAGSIAYAKQLGIVSGSAGNYRPADALTGYEFAKMLLVVIGYKAENQGYKGTNWSNNVNLDALSAGLLKGLDIDLGANILREEAAQMAFNALQAKVAYYAGNTSITIGDATIAVGGSVQLREQTLAQKLYPTLVKTAVAADDAFGYNTKAWFYNDKKVATVKDYTVVASYAGTANTLTKGALYNLFAADVTMNVYENGKDVGVDVVGDEGYTTKAGLDNFAGATVEIVKNNDGTKEVITKIATPAKVTKVVDATATDKRYIQLDTNFDGTADITKYETTSFEKDQYVLIYLKDGVIIGAEAATTTYGTVTQIAGVNASAVSSIYLDGVAVPVAGSKVAGVYNDDFTSLINKKQTLILQNGYAVACVSDAAAKATLSDYVYITKVGVQATDAMGLGLNYKMVEVVHMDGTIELVKGKYVTGEGAVDPAESLNDFVKMTDASGLKTFSADLVGDTIGTGKPFVAYDTDAETFAATTKSIALADSDKAYLTANSTVLTIGTNTAGETTAKVSAIPTAATLADTLVVYSKNTATTPASYEVEVVISLGASTATAVDLYYVVGTELGRVYDAASKATYKQVAAYEVATGLKKVVNVALDETATGFCAYTVNEYGVYDFAAQVDAAKYYDFAAGDGTEVGLYGNYMSVGSIEDADVSAAVIIDVKGTAVKTVADLMAKDKLTGADDKIAFSVYHDATNNKIKAIVVTAY